MVVLTIDGYEFYQDDMLNKEIETKVKPKVFKKDHDQVFIVDGPEGCGKSVFGMQLAKTFDNTFNIDRCCFTPIEFTKAIVNAKKGECVVFDEAFTGLSSRGALTEVNTLLVSLMMEMRQKNLFVIIIMPTYFLLDKYVALFRAKGLFHIYMKHGKRGYWTFFNTKKKKLLYLHGKKLYDYGWPKSNFKGRFTDRYVVNEAEYRKRKGEALNKKSRTTRLEKVMQQRDILLYIFNKELKITQTKMAEIGKKYKLDLERNSINESITKIANFLEKEKSFEPEKAEKDS